MVDAGTYQPRVRKTLSAVANDSELPVRNAPYAIHQSNHRTYHTTIHPLIQIQIKQPEQQVPVPPEHPASSPSS